MKKIGLICTTVLICGSLAACGSQSASSKSNSSSTKSSKVVKHHKKQAKKESKKQSSVKSNSSSSSNSSNTQKNNSGNSQAANGKVFNKSDPSTWHDIPYKGYPSYDAYCEANGGDPEVQAETASMQHAENVRRGIEDANGNETQNFQNWVSARDNAWDNGNDNFPDYDQNTQW